MTNTLDGLLGSFRARLNDDLAALWEPFDSAASGMSAPGRYATSNGGKQVRPTLYFAAWNAMADSSPADTAPALALELIHTYSLIHDDLPAMDDDDMRRGKPSLHKAYDEATAILVGDGLQARAFELIADAPELSAEQKVRMIKVLAQASGFEGMVGGQYIDIQAVDSDMTLEELRAMHEMKTGALIRASLALGGIAANATEAQLAALDEYGRNIGLAFQVVDDILDVEGDPETLGKTQGKDAEANKPTYVKLLGLDGAKAEAQRLLDEAIAALDSFGESADMLRELARYIVGRDR
ncbi:polyprenyl synthetase family protein [Seongchinamella unica]|nr:farnesyl diphosphate synthase [Seongchinamella unica]